MTVSEQQMERRVPAGSDLLLFLKKKTEGGIVHKIQPMVVPELVARFGLRWHNAEINESWKNMLRDVITRHNIGDYATVYEQLRSTNPSSEIRLVRGLRASHAHAVKNHRDKLAALISSLFTETTDVRINHVKKAVFGVEGGLPLLDDKHPLMIQLAEVQKGSIARRAFTFD